MEHKYRDSLNFIKYNAFNKIISSDIKIFIKIKLKQRIIVFYIKAILIEFER
jgi:hypothetical protein